MESTMGRMPLSVPLLLRRARAAGKFTQIVTRTPDGRASETWPEFAARTARLVTGLRRLGVRPGDRVATYAWNGHRHLELFFGVPCAGAVLHPLNVRFGDDRLVWTARHGGATTLFVGASLTGRLAPLRRELDGIRTYVVVPDGGEVHPAFAGAPRYEDLLAAVPETEPEDLDEWRPACLCHTSGTTGNPKAVVYSHRAIVLHTMGACMTDSFAIGENDTVLPLTPLFHASAWGLPYAAAFTGAGLVFAGADTGPGNVLDLIEHEGVTVAAGVPTLWRAVADADPPPERLRTLERVLCGGSAIPPDLLRAYWDRGVRMHQGWGMTEMFTQGAFTQVRAHLRDAPPDVRLDLHGTQGLPVPGVELRLCDEDGRVLPHDGVSAGEVEARGPWVTERYHEPDDDGASRFHDGWLRTGDVGVIDADGYLRLVDRVKDLIKSGGEWISSIELERLLAGHPDVEAAAVVGVPHRRWGERPVALVVRRGDVDAAALCAYLRERVVRWWVPDRVLFVREIPLTPTGKYDKKRLRTEHEALLRT